MATKKSGVKKSGVKKSGVKKSGVKESGVKGVEKKTISRMGRAVGRMLERFEVDVTPELARKWLNTRDPEQCRRVSSARIQQLVRTLENGQWASGKGIGSIGFRCNKKTKEDQLAQGQHRLLAIERYGRPVKCTVEYDIPDENIVTLDTARPRGPGDILAIERGVTKSASLKASICRVLVHGPHHYHNGSSMTNFETVEAWDIYRALVEPFMARWKLNKIPGILRNAQAWGMLLMGVLRQSVAESPDGGRLKYSSSVITGRAEPVPSGAFDVGRMLRVFQSDAAPRIDYLIVAGDVLSGTSTTTFAGHTLAFPQKKRNGFTPKEVLDKWRLRMIERAKEATALDALMFPLRFMQQVRFFVDGGSKKDLRKKLPEIWVWPFHPQHEKNWEFSVAELNRRWEITKHKTEMLR